VPNAGFTIPPTYQAALSVNVGTVSLLVRSVWVSQPAKTEQFDNVD